jgi:hypothetical protein
MDVNLTGALAINASLIQPTNAVTAANTFYGDLLPAIVPAFFGVLGVMVGAFVQYFSDEKRRNHDDQKYKEIRHYNEKKDAIQKRTEIYRKFLLATQKIIRLDDIRKKDAISENDLFFTYFEIMDQYVDIQLFGDKEIVTECIDYIQILGKYVQILEKLLKEGKMPSEEIGNELFELGIEMGKKEGQLANKMNNDIAIFSEDKLK